MVIDTSVVKDLKQTVINNAMKESLGRRRFQHFDMTMNSPIELSTARPKWRLDGPALLGNLLYSLVNHAYAPSPSPIIGQ